jgi:transcriptional regulator with XRE-family HTH domain
MSPIREYLTATGKTQKQFAADLGVREATVSAWKNGGRPRADQIERIAEITSGAIPVTVWFGRSA